MIPINKPGEVFQGSCLKCHPDALRRSDSMQSSTTSLMSVEAPIPDSPRGVDEIIDDMIKRSDSPRAQEIGCYELGNLYKDGTEMSTRHVGVIIDAMYRHADDVDVQRKACRAFRISTANSGANTSRQEIDRFIEAQGGIQVLIAAMRGHQTLSVQQEAMRTIRNILELGSDSSKNAVLDNQGIDAIIEAMKAHKKNPKVQEDGCFLLWGLAFNNITAQNVIVEKNGISAVLQAMQCLPSKENVQYRACGVLHVLSCDHAKKIAENKGYNIIIKAAMEHDSSVRLTETSFATLLNLEICVTESGCEKFFEADEKTVTFILGATQTHSESSQVQKIGPLLLERML
eukprot:CAMPEP_0195542124 /NCGR_PEP_ID=MMETSP0794_2-20130614/51441_1 /TAXON_ID=515487 /ORGANISM="Stephanopyxis turris, Strain CCMP 815" /LENGTH=343 /DNA_ID=CAMNT_0040676247 /DNA_START=225 /DNA_END=1256 /DNA_ORIENTATION=-